MKKSIWILALIALGAIIVSCEKPEGEGGAASIKGKVYNNLYDHNDKFIEREEARQENVFIIYGDNDVYDDRMDAHSDGSYEFKYLRKGNYTIFAYEDCTTCDSQTKSVEVDVEITDKKETADAPDIELKKIVDVDDGSSSIRGKVYVNEYNSSNQYMWSYYGPEEDVYIVYDTDSVYFDRMNTDSDGSFEFKNLIKGTYRVFAYSDCLSCIEGKTPVSVQVQITGKNQVITASDIVVEERP